MQRSKRFISAIGSGYVSVIASSLLALVSIPLALGELGREGFGVAATVLQISTFSQVLQLGVGPSAARFFVDYRNSNDPLRLGAFVKTVLIIGFVQGALLAALAFLSPVWLSHLFSIPSEYKAEFESVVFFVLLASSAGLALNPLQQLLYASQRIDLINYAGIIAQALGTVALIASLAGGLGLFSYAVAGWVGVITAGALSVFWVVRLGIFPPISGASCDWGVVPSLLRFSSNVMMATLGLQIIAIAPAVVINRLLGAASMGDWSVGTKLLQLGIQLTGRVSNAAEPSLWDIYGKGQKEWCSVRLIQLSQITTVVSAVIGAALLSFNGNFVGLWSGGKVCWPLQNDLLGAGLLIVVALGSTWCMLPGITKRLGIMSLIYPMEGLLVLCLLAAPTMITNLASILGGMLASMFLVRLGYGLLRLRSDLAMPFCSIVGSLKKPLFFWLCIMPLAMCIRSALDQNSSWGILAISALAGGASLIGMAYVFAIDAPEKKQLGVLLGLRHKDYSKSS